VYLDPTDRLDGFSRRSLMSYIMHLHCGWSRTRKAKFARSISACPLSPLPKTQRARSQIAPHRLRRLGARYCSDWRLPVSVTNDRSPEGRISVSNGPGSIPCYFCQLLPGLCLRILAIHRTAVLPIRRHV